MIGKQGLDSPLLNQAQAGYIDIRAREGSGTHVMILMPLTEEA
ncbi:MAG: hypothetical protein RBT37_06015 [Dissulfurispiraceae bacterium]|nr:hypothetical protein [Dissulfurispiraceae bacterium]